MTEALEPATGRASAFARAATLATDIVVDLGREIAELHRPGQRARLCGMTAISVALSVTAALALHLDDPWWAAISGFVSVQATRPASLRRGLLRITGTVIGAALGLVLASSLAYDHVACVIFLFIFTALGVLGGMLSRHGYAWLFTAVTAIMVLMGSLDEPTVALHVAFYRSFEVIVGTAAAMLVAFVLAGEEMPAAPAPPGWHLSLIHI